MQCTHSIIANNHKFIGSQFDKKNILREKVDVSYSNIWPEKSQNQNMKISDYDDNEKSS